MQAGSLRGHRRSAPQLRPTRGAVHPHPPRNPDKPARHVNRAARRNGRRRGRESGAPARRGAAGTPPDREWEWRGNPPGAGWVVEAVEGKPWRVILATEPNCQEKTYADTAIPLPTL